MKIGLRIVMSAGSSFWFSSFSSITCLRAELTLSVGTATKSSVSYNQSALAF